MAASHSDRARQAGEQRYRHLFEHMPICILVTDLTVTPVVLSLIHISEPTRPY